MHRRKRWRRWMLFVCVNITIIIMMRSFLWLLPLLLLFEWRWWIPWPLLLRWWWWCGLFERCEHGCKLTHVIIWYCTISAGLYIYIIRLCVGRILDKLSTWYGIRRWCAGTMWEVVSYFGELPLLLNYLSVQYKFTNYRKVTATDLE